MGSKLILPVAGVGPFQAGIRVGFRAICAKFRTGE